MVVSAILSVTKLLSRHGRIMTLPRGGKMTRMKLFNSYSKIRNETSIWRILGAVVSAFKHRSVAALVDPGIDDSLHDEHAKPCRCQQYQNAPSDQKQSDLPPPFQIG